MVKIHEENDTKRNLWQKKTPRINREKKKLEEARREKRVRDHPKINQMWTTRKDVQEEENSDNKNHN